MKDITCPLCGKKTKLEERKIDFWAGGKVVGQFDGCDYVCTNCGAVVADDETAKINFDARMAFWRGYFNTISEEEMLSIPKKYGVSREIVSEVLELHKYGALQSDSIWKGYAPYKDDDVKLKRALKDPKYFLSMSEKSAISEHDKERIRSKVNKIFG